MLWQAETDFHFGLVGGHFGLRATPPERAWRDVYERVNAGRIKPMRLRAFLTSHCVDIVVVTPETGRGARRAVAAAAQTRGTHAADSLVYQLRTGGSACARSAAEANPGSASGSEERLEGTTFCNQLSADVRVRSAGAWRRRNHPRAECADEHVGECARFWTIAAGTPSASSSVPTPSCRLALPAAS